METPTLLGISNAHCVMLLGLKQHFSNKRGKTHIGKASKIYMGKAHFARM